MTKPLAPDEKRRSAQARLMGNKPRGRPSKKRARGPFYQSCSDRTCGTCIRCRRAQSWQEGKYAGRRRARVVRQGAWTNELEIRRLRELAGTMDRRVIAEVLTREFRAGQSPRTAQAVAVYASRHDISLWPPGLSLWEISGLLGVSTSRIESWIMLGWLEAFEYVARAGKFASRWRVQQSALERFIRQHPEHFDAKRVKGTSRLADLARVCASRCVPVRFSKPHPVRRAAAVREPTYFGRVCEICEYVTFAHMTRPLVCRTCQQAFESKAA